MAYARQRKHYRVATREIELDPVKNGITSKNIKKTMPFVISFSALTFVIQCVSLAFIIFSFFKEQE